MGKTVIVIAHNLATISEADNIVVFADGRISGQGSHTALLETSQVYRRMWDEQQKAAHWSFVQAQGVAENRPLCGASNV